MSAHIFKLVGAAVFTATMLSACGGGGGDPVASPNPPVVTTFALKAAYQARIVSGASDDFTVAGSNGCVGTARISTEKAIPATFEGVSGASSVQVTTTLNFTNCAPTTDTTTGLNFYDANYLPIGLSEGGEYAKFESPPTDIPTLVSVGQTGTIARLITYTNSTLAVSTGTRVISYEIKAGTDAMKAVVNLVTRTYDKVNLLTTETLSYSLAQNGTLTLTLFEVQFGTTSDLRLILTPVPK